MVQSVKVVSGKGVGLVLGPGLDLLPIKVCTVDYPTQKSQIEGVKVVSIGFKIR